MSLEDWTYSIGEACIWWNKQWPFGTNSRPWSSWGRSPPSRDVQTSWSRTAPCPVRWPKSKVWGKRGSRVSDASAKLLQNSCLVTCSQRTCKQCFQQIASSSQQQQVFWDVQTPVFAHFVCLRAFGTPTGSRASAVPACSSSVYQLLWKLSGFFRSHLSQSFPNLSTTQAPISEPSSPWLSPRSSFPRRVARITQVLQTFHHTWKGSKAFQRCAWKSECVWSCLAKTSVVSKHFISIEMVSEMFSNSATSGYKQLFYTY